MADARKKAAALAWTMCVFCAREKTSRDFTGSQGMLGHTTLIFRDKYQLRAVHVQCGRSRARRGFDGFILEYNYHLGRRVTPFCTIQTHIV